MTVSNLIKKGVTSYDENIMVDYRYSCSGLVSWTAIRYCWWNYTCTNNYCSHLNHLQPNNRQEKIIDKNAAPRNLRRCVFIISEIL